MEMKENLNPKLPTAPPIEDSDRNRHREGEEVG